MQLIITILLVSLAIFALVAWVASRPRGRQLNALANVAEGTYERAKTYILDNTVGSAHLLAKLGNTVTDADLCDASDVPFGVFQDPGAAADSVAVEFLGKGRTKLGVADAAITYADLLVPAAGGEVKKIPTDPGTYWVIGRAISTQATIGGIVEYVDCVPYQATVES